MYSNENIIKRSGLEHDVVVVNQTNIKHEERRELANNCLMINTPQRGLSKSRNMAIKSSNADICVLSDDDETFNTGIQEKIEKEYINHPKADVLIFNVKNRESKNGGGYHKLKFHELLRVSSQEISFRRNSIVKNSIFFDEYMGSGTGNGAGEENKFLIECFKKGLKIYYSPLEISSVIPRELSDSKWFHGFTPEFFFQRGYSTRYILGLPASVLYAIYYVLSHGKMFKNQISKKNALKYTFKGIRNNKIARMKRSQNSNDNK